MEKQEIMNQVDTGTNRRTLIANSAVQNKLMNKQQSNNFSLDNFQSSDQSSSFTYKQYDKIPRIKYGRQR